MNTMIKKVMLSEVPVNTEFAFQESYSHPLKKLSPAFVDGNCYFMNLDNKLDAVSKENIVYIKVPVKMVSLGQLSFLFSYDTVEVPSNAMVKIVEDNDGRGYKVMIGRPDNCLYSYTFTYMCGAGSASRAVLKILNEKN